MSVSGVPIFGAIVDFTNGATFISTAFTLDDATKGKLDTGQLADASDSVDIGAICLQASIRRGRNRMLDKFEAGTATVVLQDDNGDWNPANPLGKYYGKLVPLRKIEIYADYNGTRYVLFTGFIQSYVTNFAVGVEDRSKVTLQCVDGFRTLNNAVVNTITSSAGDLSGTRITQFLNYALWPTAFRKLDAGSSTMQVDPGTANRQVLDAIQLVADKSEFGGFFIDSDGNAVFLSRDSLSKRAAAPTVTYSDDGVNVGYQGIEIMHDDILIVNDATVQRLGGTAQNVQDSASQTQYFLHSGVRQGILVQTDAEALNQAKMLLIARKDASLRISSLSLNLFDPTSPDRIVAGLNSEIYDPISVTKTMPGSSSLTRILFVQGINHDMTKRSFTTKLMTAEPIIQSFILNSSLAGVLDSTAGLLSY